MNKTTNIIKEEPFVGLDGLNYIKITKEILIPRKTYIKGIVTGKYRGEKVPDEDDTDLFNFEIYEATVTCNSIEDFSKNIPFVFPKDFNNNQSTEKITGTVFPKDKLPTTLAVQITTKNKTFGINILEPKLFAFSTIRKLHQTEGDEVFGSFNAYITGYVLDYERKEVIEIIGPILEQPPHPPEPPRPPHPPELCEKSTIETGKTEHQNNYYRKEYLCKNKQNQTYWGEWINKKGRPNQYSTTNQSAGCFETIIKFIGIIIGLLFLFIAFPSFIYLLAFYILTLIIEWFAPYLKLFLKIIGILLIIIFVLVLINGFINNNNSYRPSPVIVDSRELSPVIQPIDSIKNSNDKWIIRFRKWQDYDGKIYQGEYKVKTIDYYNANTFKNNLKISQNSINAYDRIIYNLKEYDKDKLNYLYPLFDSIRKNNQLNQIKFAEMIVSFVQDIPYAIILENECDASLYNDSFTKEYLLQNKGDCAGNQRFGLNSPIEFLANLKGDCDTRALLLYTIFTHYNYDVAVLSSEFYGHSIIGINLPINGTAYTYKNQRYVLWETTAPNNKPGILSNEISNLNNWRISLKSK